MKVRYTFWHCESQPSGACNLLWQKLFVPQYPDSGSKEYPVQGPTADAVMGWIRAFSQRQVEAVAYDALESAAKTKYNAPDSTFGEVLNTVQRQGLQNEATVRLLRAVEVFGHNTFRHGRIEAFNFSPSEVVFVFSTCVAGILIFAA